MKALGWEWVKSSLAKNENVCDEQTLYIG